MESSVGNIAERRRDLNLFKLAQPMKAFCVNGLHCLRKPEMFEPFRISVIGVLERSTKARSLHYHRREGLTGKFLAGISQP